MLGADNWCVKVKGKVYGPYTSLQLKKFAQQGRLAANSLIAPAGSKSWRRVTEESVFKNLPLTNDNQPAAKSKPKTETSAQSATDRATPTRSQNTAQNDVSQDASSFGRRDVDADANVPEQTYGDFSASSPAGANQSAGAPRRAKRLGQVNKPINAEPTGPSNFVIIFDVVSGAASRVSSAIQSLGASFRLADNVWTARCSLTAHGVKNAIAPFLKPGESLFIVDATNGRTAWQGYGPEPHAKISSAFMLNKQ